MKDFRRGISVPEKQLSGDIDDDGEGGEGREEQQDTLVQGEGVPKVFAGGKDFCQEAHVGEEGGFVLPGATAIGVEVMKTGPKGGGIKRMGYEYMRTPSERIM